MKNMKISIFLGALLGSFASAAPAVAADLLDVYRLAQQNDPEIAAAEANYFAAAERSPQARAAYLPQLSASASYTITDETESTSDQVDFQDVDGNPATPPSPIVIPQIESFRDGDGWDATLSLRQTIFNWATINQIQQASAEVARAEAEYRAAQQQLIIRVAENYFNLLGAKDSLEAAEINREAIGRQLDQAKKRFEVGLIAITDVQESQAAFDQATAEAIAAERAVNSARENLRAVIGEYVDDPAAPSAEMPLASPQPESAESWVEQALEQNLDVVANRFALEAAEQTTDIRNAGHYPTLDLVARHTESEGTNQSSYFGGALPELDSSSTSDYIGLELSVPLFSGGSTSSQAREAAYLESAARSGLKRAMRTAEATTRDTFLGVMSDIARVQALKQAYESAQTALRATTAGYEVGTRTAVDVLDARRNELTALVNYQRARYDYVLNTLRLRQATGMLTPDDVAEVAKWME